MKYENGSRYIKRDGSDSLEYEVVANGTELYSAEMGNEPEAVVILRPVLSGTELAEADQTGVVTWFVVTELIFEDIFEAA